MPSQLITDENGCGKKKDYIVGNMFCINNY